MNTTSRLARKIALIDPLIISLIFFIAVALGFADQSVETIAASVSAYFFNLVWLISIIKTVSGKLSTSDIVIAPLTTIAVCYIIMELFSALPEMSLSNNAKMAAAPVFVGSLYFVARAARVIDGGLLYFAAFGWTGFTAWNIHAQIRRVLARQGDPEFGVEQFR